MPDGRAPLGYLWDIPLFSRGRPVKARTKFLAGRVLVLGTASYLMASSINEIGQYYLTPTELASKVADSPRFRNNGVKVDSALNPRA